MNESKHKNERAKREKKSGEIKKEIRMCERSQMNE